jgi:hypothetical protein
MAKRKAKAKARPVEAPVVVEAAVEAPVVEEPVVVEEEPAEEVVVVEPIEEVVAEAPVVEEEPAEEVVVEAPVVEEEATAMEEKVTLLHELEDALRKSINLLQRVQHSAPGRRCALCHARGIHRKGCELGDFLAG